MSLEEYAERRGAGVLVMTKPSCPQCTATKRWLDKNGIPYCEEGLTDESLKLAIGEGIASAPVVVAPGLGSWGGFQPNRLKDL